MAHQDSALTTTLELPKADIDERPRRVVESGK